MEASCGAGQGPGRAVASCMEWNGCVCILVHVMSAM